MLIKCVVVEDAPFLREVYRLSLRHEAIEIVAEAEDGVEALKLISAHQPDLVILDLVLPLKNGLDVLKELHVHSPLSQCLVVSSLDDEKTIAQAKALGAVAYLTKPFTKAVLIQTIQDMMIPLSEVKNG
jgi:two-component system chemotaxis response regulator CheY